MINNSLFMKNERTVQYGLATVLTMVVFFFPISGKAQTLETPTLDKQPIEQLETIYDDILDYEHFDNCLDLECKTTEEVTKYIYKTNIVPDNNDKIISYNTEKDGSTYKVYAGSPYYNDGSTWVETKVEYADKIDFDYVEYEKVLDGKEPISFLINRLNPFRIYSVNAQTSYYSGAGDGCVYYATVGHNWDTSHDASSGNAAYTGASCAIKSDETNTYEIFRGFFPIDTSAIEDDYTVTEAHFYFTIGTNIWTEMSDSYEYFTLVETSQASDSTLVGADYDNCGAVNNPTELNDAGNRLDLTTISTDTEYSIELNSTGISVIDDTGTTFIGIRDGHDTADISVNLDSGSGADIYFSEQTGTDKDPYLLLTVTEGEEEEEEPTATSTSIAVPCDMNYSTDLTIITGCTEIYTDSTTTPSETRYTYYHIPFFYLVLIYAVVFPLLMRFLIEIIISWRR